MTHQSPASTDDWSSRLLELGLAVQTRIASVVSKAAGSGFQTLAEAVSEAGGDRIYRIDREAEEVIDSTIGNWPEECFPLLLIAEGMGDDGRKKFGPEAQPVRWRLIVDPIDGTRMLMYDKRPAWFLAAVCPDRGENTTLRDSVAAVLVELPTSKQHLADALVASADRPARGFRFEVDRSTPPRPDRGGEFNISPSTKTDLRDGFATVLSMFPGTRRLASDLAERIAEHCGVVTEVPTVFDDQYISCGGLFYQLMTGRDLCCIDLRPHFNRILARSDQPAGRLHFIESHPYDLAGLLAAERSGVILTDASGNPLNAPLDVETGVAWCGYANESIQNLIEPAVQAWLTDQAATIDPARSD